jgi:hypothetical protein
MLASRRLILKQRGVSQTLNATFITKADKTVSKVKKGNKQKQARKEGNRKCNCKTKITV